MVKPLTEFYDRENGKKRGDCKDCVKAKNSKHYYNNKEKHQKYGREYRLKNPERKRDLYLRNKYNITLAEYNTLSKEQNGTCAIEGCECTELVVDHDHKTGKIRGLLCSNHNVGLGHFSDNIKYLEAAIKYPNGS